MLPLYQLMTVNKLISLEEAYIIWWQILQSYNSFLTKNKDQKLYLLQVVEQHRQKLPDATKAAVDNIFKETIAVVHVSITEHCSFPAFNRYFGNIYWHFELH